MRYFVNNFVAGQKRASPGSSSSSSAATVSGLMAAAAAARQQQQHQAAAVVAGTMTREELERHLEMKQSSKPQYMSLGQAMHTLPDDIFGNEDSNPGGCVFSLT